MDIDGSMKGGREGGRKEQREEYSQYACDEFSQCQLRCGLQHSMIATDTRVGVRLSLFTFIDFYRVAIRLSVIVFHNSMWNLINTL